ncbi:MAG: hypothetical protein V4537_14550 [Pseudomonadota bacterium]
MSQTAATKRTPVPWHVITRVAGKVPADPKTVRKVILGEPVRGSVYERVCAALKDEGIEYPAPADDAE